MQNFKTSIDKFIRISRKLGDSWLSNGLNTFIYKKMTFGKFLFIEYHIVYSHSFQQPLLLFRLFNDSGYVLSLNAIEHNFPLSIITPIEHPILNSPFYYIHPCLIKENLIEHHFGNFSDIVSWLSLVGPVVGCNLDLEYFLESKIMD
jgi:ubiquitin-like-conjugating enzyme ATG10